MKKLIIYIDMDGVLVDFESALMKVPLEMLEKFAGECANIPAFLIDDRTTKGVAEFVGRHIHFGSSEFPDWQSVLDELL